MNEPNIFPFDTVFLLKREKDFVTISLNSTGKVIGQGAIKYPNDKYYAIVK